MCPRTILALAVCLLASGCADSKNPLSDPQTSKTDERLSGVWRGRGKDGEPTYCHVGQAGENFPGSMMRVVAVKHSRGKVEPPEECLIFPTVLGDKTYLNLVRRVVQDGELRPVNRLNEKGWKADAVPIYAFARYQVDGDKLVVWLMDEGAKARAIKGGKIKGDVGPPATFTDTTENVARFVTEAGDSLLNMKEPGRFERVETGR